MSVNPKHDSMLNQMPEAYIRSLAEGEECVRRYFEHRGSRSDTMVGQVARCQIIVEHFLTKYLETVNSIMSSKSGSNVSKLTFDEKIRKATPNGSPIAEMTSSLDALRKIRNNYVHNLHYEITDEDCAELRTFSKSMRLRELTYFNSNIENENDVFEEYALSACMMLGAFESMVRNGAIHP
jgi:hypothetical protein